MIPPGVQLCGEKGFDSVSEGNAIGKAQGCHESQMCRQAKLSQSSGCQSALSGGAWRLGWVPWKVLGSSSPVDPAPSAGQLLSSQPWKSQQVACAPFGAAWSREQPAPPRRACAVATKGAEQMLPLQGGCLQVRPGCTGATGGQRALTSASRPRVGTHPGRLWCRGICRTWRGRTPLEIQ